MLLNGTTVIEIVLNSDIIHLKKPFGRNWDGICHVIQILKGKGIGNGF